MKTVAVIHFLPLEYYPPVTNFLDVLSRQLPTNKTIYVYSSRNVKGRNEYRNDNIKINRFPFPNMIEWRLLRMIKYLNFNLFTLLSLIYRSPKAILYYESYSAWPVYWYVKFFNSNCKIFIHFHEYSHPEWYEKGMASVKLYHSYEVNYLFKNACWISQTNLNRLSFFYNDYPFINPSILKVLSNYPPLHWSKIAINKRNYSSPIRCVYIGSLSLGSTYIQEFCFWVESQNGLIQFDIYSYNLDEETKHFLENSRFKFSNFNGKGIEYHNIPQLLSEYDIGLILYKPHSINYIFNAPNKLFEYLACGVDVWFPDEMKGCTSYINIFSKPKVIALNFRHLELYSLEELISEPKDVHSTNIYSADKEYQPLIWALCNI